MHSDQQKRRAFERSEKARRFYWPMTEAFGGTVGMSEPRKPHYLPPFYLRGFSANETSMYFGECRLSRPRGALDEADAPPVAYGRTA